MKPLPSQLAQLCSKPASSPPDMPIALYTSSVTMRVRSQRTAATIRSTIKPYDWRRALTSTPWFGTDGGFDAHREVRLLRAAGVRKGWAFISLVPNSTYGAYSVS